MNNFTRLIENTDFWYHGRTTTDTKFDLKYIGKGNDQDGPGFYFTNNENTARGYAHPNGIIIEAELNYKKVLKQRGKAKRSEVSKLIKQAPDLNDRLQDWDEDPYIAFNIALESIIKYNSGTSETFQQVWIDFYRYDPDKYIQNVVKMGYDVQETVYPDNIVVLNSKIIKIIRIIKV